MYLSIPRFPKNTDASEFSLLNHQPGMTQIKYNDALPSMQFWSIPPSCMAIICMVPVVHRYHEYVLFNKCYETLWSPGQSYLTIKIHWTLLDDACSFLLLLEFILIHLKIVIHFTANLHTFKWCFKPSQNTMIKSTPLTIAPFYWQNKSLI